MGQVAEASPAYYAIVDVVEVEWQKAYLRLMLRPGTIHGGGITLDKTRASITWTPIVRMLLFRDIVNESKEGKHREMAAKYPLKLGGKKA